LCLLPDSIYIYIYRDRVSRVRVRVSRVRVRVSRVRVRVSRVRVRVRVRVSRVVGSG
jgi:hypothetical protein